MWDGKIGNDVRYVETPCEIIMPAKTVVGGDIQSPCEPANTEHLKLPSVPKVDNDISAQVREGLVCPVSYGEVDRSQGNRSINPQPLGILVLDFHWSKDVLSGATPLVIPTFIPVKAVGMTVDSEHIIRGLVSALAHPKPVPVSEARASDSCRCTMLPA